MAAVVERGRVGETYHVGSGEEATIEELADGVLAAMGKPATLKQVVPDRPGHDRRYLLDSTRIRDELGWLPATPWAQGLADTVAWYAERRDWWEPLVGRTPVAETGWGSGAGHPDRWLGGRASNGEAGAGRTPDQDEMEHSPT